MLLLNATEMFHRIPAPCQLRMTCQPRPGGERHGPPGTDSRLAFVTVLRRGLGSGEFLFNQSPIQSSLYPWYLNETFSLAR